MKDNSHQCGGRCCQAFSLGSRLDLLKLEVERCAPDDEEGQREAAFLIDMLIPLGSFNRNPLFRVWCERTGAWEDGPVVRNPDTQRDGWFYTCRHFDKETALCTAYAQRPYMCRVFPNSGGCPYEGCDHHVPARMVRSWEYEGVQFAGRYSSDDERRIAAALGAEPTSRKARKCVASR